jgi:hypothetical protein
MNKIMIRKIQRLAWRNSYASGMFKRRERRGFYVIAGKKVFLKGAWHNFTHGSN